MFFLPFNNIVRVSFKWMSRLLIRQSFLCFLAGGFMFEGMSDDEDEFQSVSQYQTAKIMYRNTDAVWCLMLLIAITSLGVPKYVWQSSPAGPSNRGGVSAGMRPVSLSHSGATGPRPITQSELATALALASTPDSSAVTPTTASQVRVISILRQIFKNMHKSLKQ